MFNATAFEVIPDEKAAELDKRKGSGTGKKATDTELFAVHLASLPMNKLVGVSVADSGKKTARALKRTITGAVAELNRLNNNDIIVKYHRKSDADKLYFRLIKPDDSHKNGAVTSPVAAAS